MSITIHQRVHGYLWHWKDGPGWCRDGAEIAKLRADGMRVLKVHLADDGPIPTEQAKEWRDAGMKVWGMTWLTPSSTPEALKAERDRLSLTGLDLNGEEPVRALDAATNGQWSATFAARLRQLCPTLPLHFDSYKGSAAATPGINLGAWKAAGCRFSMQTFWGAEGLWDDPTTEIVKWCAGANPTIPKAIVKPIFRVAPNNAKELPDWEVVFADTVKAATKGLGLYYIDGCDFDLLRWLIRESIRKGCAF